MMPTEPAVEQTVAPPPQVTVTTTVASDQFGELSKRVDQTHDLVLALDTRFLGLDTRFETHRVRTDDRLAAIVAGIYRIEQVQAVEAGKEEEAEEAENEAVTKRGQRIQVKNNLITAASVIATILSTVAVVLTATSAH